MHPKRLAVLVAVAVMVAAMLVGCGGTQKAQIVDGSYKALSIGGNTYDAAMAGVAELYKQGHVGDEEKMQALELGNYYHDAYHTAVEALKEYAGTDVEVGDLQTKLLKVGEALGRLLAYINPLLNKYGMEAVQ